MRVDNLTPSELVRTYRFLNDELARNLQIKQPTLEFIEGGDFAYKLAHQTILISKWTSDPERKTIRQYNLGKKFDDPRTMLRIFIHEWAHHYSLYTSGLSARDYSFKYGTNSHGIEFIPAINKVNDVANKIMGTRLPVKINYSIDDMFDLDYKASKTDKTADKDFVLPKEDKVKLHPLIAKSKFSEADKIYLQSFIDNPYRTLNFFDLRGASYQEAESFLLELVSKKVLSKEFLTEPQLVALKDIPKEIISWETMTQIAEWSVMTGIKDLNKNPFGYKKLSEAHLTQINYIIDVLVSNNKATRYYTDEIKQVLKGGAKKGQVTDGVMRGARVGAILTENEIKKITSWIIKYPHKDINDNPYIKDLDNNEKNTIFNKIRLFANKANIQLELYKKNKWESEYSELNHHYKTLVSILKKNGIDATATTELTNRQLLEVAEYDLKHPFNSDGRPHLITDDQAVEYLKIFRNLREKKYGDGVKDERSLIEEWHKAMCKKFGLDVIKLKFKVGAVGGYYSYGGKEKFISIGIVGVGDTKQKNPFITANNKLQSYGYLICPVYIHEFTHYYLRATGYTGASHDDTFKRTNVEMMAVANQIFGTDYTYVHGYGND